MLFQGCKTAEPLTEKQPEDSSKETPAPQIFEDDLPSRVPASPDTISYELPDGYILKIRLIGDEFYHQALTVDGFPIVLNPEGFYEYTSADDQGLPQATGVVARNPEDRTHEEKQFLKSVRR